MLHAPSLKAYKAARPRQIALAKVMIPLLAVLCLLAFLTSCAGLGDQINKQSEKATTALMEAAKVVENARCEFRTVGVLSRMIEERGVAWAAGYFLSCPQTKAIINTAKVVPIIRVE